jgi:hypothetical protein
VASGGTRAASALAGPADRAGVGEPARSAFASGLDVTLLACAGSLGAGALAVALLVRPAQVARAGAAAPAERPMDTEPVLD